jgi:hypothetical protein
MATVTIPTDLVALFWTQSTTLDGVVYFLTFRYNTRESCYYLQIDSADGTVNYAQGIKLVSNFPLLQSYGDNPPGEMMCVSFSGDDSPAQVGQLGDGQRVNLLYTEEADLIAGWNEPQRNPGPFLPGNT